MIADIAVRSPDGRLQLVVEVKASSSIDEQWASKYRRNLFAHSMLRDAQFFMLVSSKHIYLWTNIAGMDVVLPEYQANTSQLLDSYFRYSSSSTEAASEFSLEIAAAAWLNDVILSIPSAEELKIPLISDSGLYQAIRGGFLETEVDL